MMKQKTIAFQKSDIGKLKILLSPNEYTFVGETPTTVIIKITEDVHALLLKRMIDRGFPQRMIIHLD